MPSKATIPILASRLNESFTAGELDYLHGFTLGGGKLWGSAQMSPGKAVVFEDTDNLLDNTITDFPNDGIHAFGIDIAYGARPGSSSAFACWTLNNNSWLDSVGGRHLLENGVVNSVAGKIGNAAEFPQPNGGQLSNIDPVLGMVDADFSVRAWVRIPSASSSPGQIIGRKSNLAGWAIRIIGPTAPFTWDVHLNNVTLSGGTALLANTWYHLVFTYKVSTNTLNLYLNGVLDATAVRDAPTLATDDFVIGLQDTGPVQVDEVVIWTKELTGVEITTDYNAGTGTSCPIIDGTDTPLIYVLHRNIDRTVIGAINPIDLDVTTPINDATVANTNGSIAITPTHLFVATYFGTVGDNSAPDAEVLKFLLSDYSKTPLTLTGLKQCHCIRYDGENLYATGVTNGSSRAWLAKIDPVALTYSSVLLPDGIGIPTDDLAFTEDNIWIGTESPSGLKLGHMLVMAKSDLSVVQNITPVIPSDFYGVANDGNHIWGFCTKTGAQGKMIRFDPATYEQRLYSFNDDEGEPNEMVTLSGYLFITLWKAGVNVTRLKIPST